MSTTATTKQTPAANPYDYRRVDGCDFEVYDTRTGRVLSVCLHGSTAAELEADRLWQAEVLAAAETHPADAEVAEAEVAPPAAWSPTDDTALAEHILGELNELEHFAFVGLTQGERYAGEADDIDAAMAVKREELARLGYTVTAVRPGAPLTLLALPAPEPAPTSPAAVLAGATRDELAAHTIVNPWFGVLTRGAFDLYLSTINWTGMAVVYFDIDGLKAANTRWGKAAASARVAAALHARREDIGTWFSGDEFALVVPVADALGVARRLQAALHAQELSATFAIVTGPCGPQDIDEAERIVSRAKEQGRGSIYLGAHTRRRGDRGPDAAGAAVPAAPAPDSPTPAWQTPDSRVMTAQIAADQALDEAGLAFDYARAIARAQADRRPSDGTPPPWVSPGSALRHGIALDHARTTAHASGRRTLGLSFQLQGRKTTR